MSYGVEDDSEKDKEIEEKKDNSDEAYKLVQTISRCPT
jgi:hypothetical protein